MKKLEKRDYGRIALWSFLLKAIETAIEIPIPELSLLLLIISDVILVVGMVCGVIWMVKTIKERVNHTSFRWDLAKVTLGIYTILNIKLISPLFFSYLILDVDPKMVLIIFISLFLNAALFIYCFKNTRITKIALIIYTFLNFSLLYPFIFTSPMFDLCFGCYGGRMVDYSVVFVSLFLNALLLIYWSRSNNHKIIAS